MGSFPENVTATSGEPDRHQRLEPNSFLFSASVQPQSSLSASLNRFRHQKIVGTANFLVERPNRLYATLFAAGLVSELIVDRGHAASTTAVGWHRTLLDMRQRGFE